MKRGAGGGAHLSGGRRRAVGLHGLLDEHRKHDLAPAVDEGPNAVEALEPVQRLCPVLRVRRHTAQVRRGKQDRRPQHEQSRARRARHAVRDHPVARTQRLHACRA
jgi:hypothetical protein